MKSLYILPANFQLVDGEPLAFGVAHLELKDEFKRPWKRVPLFSNLEKGDYEIASSKSDGNIASTIQFFSNLLPSFKRYVNDDDTSWVVSQHIFLVAGMFADDANHEKLPSTAIMKTKMNAITRIF